MGDFVKHIKNTVQLFRLDWQRIFKNPIATLLIIALMIIPSLYAWFNIKALWDPYSNTGELPIAVYSGDKGASFNDETVEIGKEVIASLHKNKQLGWKFVDSKEKLVEGVKSGKYYAGIYLPQDFSENLLSFTSGDIVKPKIDYYLNEKINAIAPKITDKGATAIQTQISDEFINTASSTLMKVFNEVGYDIDSNLVSINKLTSMIKETNANLDEIDGYTKQILDLNEKMPDIKEKLAKANEFVAYLPEVDELGTKIVTLNEKMPDIAKQASVILTLQDKIPELQNAGKQIGQINDDFDQIYQTMTDGISEAKTGLSIIQQVQTALPDIEDLGAKASDFASTTKDGAQQLNDALPSIQKSVEVTLGAVGNVANTTTSLAATLQSALADNQLTDDEKTALLNTLQNFSDSLTSQQSNLDSLISFLDNLQKAAGNTELAGTISKLQDLKTNLSTLQTRVNNISDAINQGTFAAEADELLSGLQSAGNAISSAVAAVPVESITESVSSLLTKLIATIDSAQGLLTKAQSIDFATLLSSTEKTVSNAVAILEKYQKEMPEIKQEVKDADDLLNGHMDEIVAAINKGADLYNNELPTLQEKLSLAAKFMQNDWPGIEKDITDTLTTVNDKMPDVEKALGTVTDLINNDWPAIKDGVQKAAAAIDKGEQLGDLGDLIKLLKLDANAESDFFTNPVELNTNAMYPIANNGSASTPFYTALCLWVGAVLFSSIATTEVFIDKKDRGKFSKRETFCARGLTFLAMGLAQALIVSLGNVLILGVDVANPVYSVLFALFIGLVFTTMVYVLVALFGTVGKGLAIIILVLSISGGGGNYPIQVSGKFFQMVNPLLPFTYAVDLLRESAGGIYWPNASKYLVILLGVMIVFAIVGPLVYPLLEEKLRKLGKIAHESKIFH